jgi:hypothetical protein
VARPRLLRLAETLSSDCRNSDACDRCNEQFSVLLRECPGSWITVL